MDSDRYDIQATADCSGGALSGAQVQLMIQSMLEDRFQLKELVVAADPLPSLFTAIQQLGLRLDSARRPVEVLVVDSVQKPTEN